MSSFVHSSNCLQLFVGPGSGEFAISTFLTTDFLAVFWDSRFFLSFRPLFSNYCRYFLWLFEIYSNRIHNAHPRQSTFPKDPWSNRFFSALISPHNPQAAAESPSKHSQTRIIVVSPSFSGCESWLAMRREWPRLGWSNSNHRPEFALHNSKCQTSGG